MRQLWPGSDPSELTDTDLARLYPLAGPDRPGLRVNLITSLDGAASVRGSSRPMSGPADRRLLGLLRTGCDALVVGAATATAERYGPLDLGPARRAWRAAHGLPEDPPLVLLSRSLRLDPGDPMFTAAPVRPIVLTTTLAPTARRTALERVAEVIRTGRHTVDLTAGLAHLRSRGFTHLLCEGGPRVMAALTAADLTDEVCLTLSPLLVGATGAASAGPTSQVRRMTLRHVLAADGMLMLRYTRDTPDTPRATPPRGSPAGP